MEQFLLKNYRNIISFVLLLLAICLHAFSAPTPTCPIVTERFQGLGDGTTSNNSSTGWYLDGSNVVASAYFAVKSNRFHAQELGGEGRWYSKVFSVSGYSDFQVAVKVSSEGDMNSSEYVKIYYKINGGAETLLDSRTGNFGTIDFISPTLTGNNVQIIVKLYNYNNGGSQTSKYYIEEYRVFKEHGPCSGSIPVSATAGNGGILTCSNPTLTVSASTSVTGTTTWNWTGPNGFTSTSQNSSVNAAGTYTVVGTNAAGSGSATVTVSENKAAPVITATGGNLACASSIVIGATSSISGSAFSWTGPGGFTSTLQNPSVSAAGTYTVTVTNPANGCYASQSVTVTAGAATPTTLWSENFTLANNTTASGTWSSTTPGGIFSVQSNEFRINNLGTSGEGVWTSGSISITGKTNISISAGVRSGVSSGGALENSGSSLDYVRFYYKLNNGSEILFSEYLGTINSNNATNTAVSIGSLSGSTLEIVIRSRTTASDEFYYFDNISVTGINSAATISPSVTGIVTCINSAQLSATVSGGTVSSWAWTGPNGFTSSLQSPVVNAGGQYIVTATLSSGGCSVSSSLSVPQNKTVPDIMASGGALACLSGITLNVSSSVPGVTYGWTGPGGFTSNSANPVVTTAGSYTATVTNPSNGCTASQQVSVTASTMSWVENFSLTNGTTVDNGSTPWSVTVSPASTLFSVLSNEFRVSNSSTTGEGVWTSGAINIDGINNVSLSINVRSAVTGSGAMNTSGEFADYIRFYYKLNNSAPVMFAEKLGAINSHSITPSIVTINSLTGDSLRIIVRARVTGNDEFYFLDNVQATGTALTNVDAIATGTLLTCANASGTITGNSTIPGVQYNWTGPGSFSSTTQNPTVNVPGVYTLTVTNPSTGCTATDTALVNQNIAAPANLTTVSNSGSNELTCLVGGLTLTGNSSTAGATYSWTLPNGIIGVGNVTSATLEGGYIFTATNPVNGCIATSTFNVVRNMSTPVDGTITGGNQFLTCISPGATLTASNSLPGVVYNWIGPNGYTASGPSVTVSRAGFYNVIMTHPVTGCNHSIGAAVLIDTTSPANLAINISSVNTQLTCTNNNVQLAASTSTSGTSYQWIGPGDLISSAPVININQSGEYFLIATSTATGCVRTVSRFIAENRNLPANVTAAATNNGGQLTCAVTSISLAGGSSTPGVTYAWNASGFSATTQNISVNIATTYTLTVTDPSNGCMASAPVTVTSNTVQPAGVSATFSDVLTCFTTEVDLTGTSTTPGASYLWTGPFGFTSGNRITQTGVPGTYQLRVTNPANGCFRIVSTTVEEDKAPPADIMANNTGPITCSITSVSLLGSSSASDIEYMWTGPGNFVSFLQNPTVSVPGEYTLTVTDLATNGCSGQATTTIAIIQCDGNDKHASAGNRNVVRAGAAVNSEENPASSNFEFKAYPNPFNEKAIIEFKSTVNDFIRIELYNSNGVIIKPLFSDHVVAGRSYQVHAEGNNLSQGMYYFMIRTGNRRVFSSKLLLIKR